MEFAELAATRSGCLSRQVGCVIVKDNRVIATGYNAAPLGVMECCEKGFCLRANSPSGESLDRCLAVHAEQNALAQCAKYGISCEGATLYVTTQPCSRCLKMIINAGIKTIIFRDAYPDDLTLYLSKQSGVDIHQYEK